MSVLTPADAAAYLKVTETLTPALTAFLQEFIDAAEGAVAARVGPLEPVEVTEQVRGGSPTDLLLSTIPTISITSITSLVGGGTVDASALVLEKKSGVVTSYNGTPFTDQAYEVVYQAGHDPLPSDLLQAVKEMLRWLWDSQRGGGFTTGPKRSTEKGNTVPGAEDAMPFEVSRLLVPYALDAVGGIG